MWLIFKKVLQSNHFWLYLALIVFIFLEVLPVYSQFSPNQFTFDVSWARFRLNEKLNFVEIYLAIPLNQLTFQPENDRLQCGFIISLKAIQNDSVYFEQQVRHPFATDPDTAETIHKVIPIIKSLGLPAGNFETQVEVTDLFSSKSRKVSLAMNLEAIPTDRLFMSNIEFASSIERDSVQTDFFKNSYKVIPNASTIYSANLPNLFYYAEIYNLEYNSPQDTFKYQVTSRILNGQNQEVKALPVKLRRKGGNSAVEVGRINILTLNSGMYFLELEVTDLADGERHQQSNKFYIYRPEAISTEPAVVTTGSGVAQDNTTELYPDSRYTIMPEAEINEEFETTKYIATKDEKNTFKKLDLDGRRKYIVEFWAKRDLDPSTKKNEYREEYLSRVRYANDQFTGFQKGWKSDRGRVLLIYGHPDEIERFPFSSDTKPYQIWKYFSIQGGVEFVFVDKRSFGNMELIHSTARGELNDPEWERWINANN